MYCYAAWRIDRLLVQVLLLGDIQWASVWSDGYCFMWTTYPLYIMLSKITWSAIWAAQYYCQYQIWFVVVMILYVIYNLIAITVHGKISVGEKIGKFGESRAIHQNFPCQYSQIHGKHIMAYALTVAYLPNFSSPIAFTCMVHQNFTPPNISHVRYLHMNNSTEYYNISTCQYIVVM